ncbi:MAG: type transport system permease protein [Thermodesulfobacteriota bacterium]|nr:type transport system permease protein [Thermodesulfobacteriota bacterium]
MPGFLDDVLILLRPRFLSFKNPLVAANSKKEFYRNLFLGTAGFLFWIGIFIISLRTLKYFYRIEGLGDILVFKLLSMLVLTSFSFLIFSSILTSLSKLYLSRDLELVHSMPVSGNRIFFARWIESTADSSWMVVIYTLPVFVALGVVNKAGLFFYLNTALVLLSLSFIASGISSVLVMAAVFIIPAGRMKSILLFLGFTLFLTLFMVFRMLKPEQLVDPDVFATVVVYLDTLKAPSSPLLPSTWVYDSIKESLSGSLRSSFFHSALSWSFVSVIIFINILIADLIYRRGFSKSQTASSRVFRYKYSDFPFTGFLTGASRAFVVKEIKTFFRDQTQWSQLLLIGALVIIYVFNFSVLPLERAPIKTIYLQNLLAFLNMGLCLFVLTAVAGRFAYPAVSSERDAFWLVKASPVKIKTILWIKFFIYFLPLLILSEILIVATNIILQVDAFMMALSFISVLLIVPGIVSIGIGFGAAYPDFKSENPAQSVTSFGGLLFMMICAGYIMAVIILEAGPVYDIFMASVHQRSMTVLQWLRAVISFSIVIVISILAIILPMRFGEKGLSKVLP